MRFAFLITAGLSALSLATFAQTPQSTPPAEEVLPIGSVLPHGDAPLIDVRTQKAVALNSLVRARGLLVIFSCNTCPYVIKSQARTLEMIRFAESKELGVVVVNSNEARRGDDDSPAEMVQYASKQGYPVPYVVDPESRVADAFGATRTPEVYLFDRDQKLLYKGAMEDNPTEPQASKKLYLKSAIEHMVAGKPVNPSSTKSIGCSIKRRTL